MHHIDEGRPQIVFKDIGREIQQSIERTGRNCYEVHSSMARDFAKAFEISESTMKEYLNRMIQGYIYQTTSGRALASRYGEKHRGILGTYLFVLGLQNVDVQPIVDMIREVDEGFEYPPSNKYIRRLMES